MSGLSDTMRGALFMMGSMACFVLNDACMKGLSGELPLAQAVFLRSVSTTVVMLAMISVVGGLRFRMSRRDRILVAIRNVSEVATAFFFINALFNMPLANATAIMQVLPLSVAVAAALFLGQTFGWRRLMAILAGFAGVLLIVQPGAEGFNIYSLHALAAVICVTIRDLLARVISPEVPTLYIAMMNAVWVMIVFGIASVFVQWAPVDGLAALQLFGASTFIIGGYVFSVAAMRRGDIPTITPFRYTALLWSLALGVLFFGEWPDALTFLGGAIVVGTGIYTFYRERRATMSANQGI